MNFLEALQTYSPNGRKINSLTSTFKEFDDIFGGLPQYGVVSVIGETCSKLESLTLSMISNYVNNHHISNILYLNFRGELHEQTIINNLFSIIFDFPYNHLCNCENWQKNDYEKYDAIKASKILKHEECFKNLFIESLSATDEDCFHKTIYKYYRECGIRMVFVDDFANMVKCSNGLNDKNALIILNEICSIFHIPVILNVPSDRVFDTKSILYHSNLVIDIAPINYNTDDKNDVVDIHVLKNDFGVENGTVNLFYNKTTRGIYSHKH